MAINLINKRILKGFAMEVKRVSKGLYLGGYIAAVVIGTILIFTGAVGLGFGGAMAEEGGNSETTGFAVAGIGGLLMILGVLLSLFGSVLWFVLIYKMWAAIQDGGFARTTPGKAVGFMFIPFFNIYWIFQAFWGFSKDYNTKIEAQQIGTEYLPEGLFLTACILPLCGMIPFVGGFVQIANMVIVIICLNYICNAINALASTIPADAEIDQLQV